MQNSFADLKIQTRKYLACIQNNSLLPFATCCMGILIGIMLLYIILVSVVSLGIGIGVKFVLPRYNIVKIIANFTAGHSSMDNIDKETKYMINKTIEILLNMIIIYGSQHFILGIISIFSCLIILIAIATKMQIVYFIFLFIFFIIGCYFIEIGTALWPLLMVKLREILNYVLIDKFDWSLCNVCDSKSTGNMSKSGDINVFIDMSIAALKNVFDCCGVDSPEDFGKKAGNNRIPYICCVDSSNINITVLAECYLRDASPGCFGKVVQRMDEYKLYFTLYSVAYIVSGLLMFSIVIIGILQTIYFYLSGSHKTDLKVMNNNNNKDKLTYLLNN